MSKLLSLLRSNIAGIPVQIHGEKFVVVELSQKTAAALMVEAESIARNRINKDDFKGPLSEMERKELSDLLTRMNAERKKPTAAELKRFGRYEYEVMKRRLVEFGRLTAVQVLRNEDGTPVYETEQEREQISMALMADNEASRIIDEAMTKSAEKKRSHTAKNS